MFTGIVEERGHVRLAEPDRIVVEATSLDDVGADDSVAVSGVCLTVVSVERDGDRVAFGFDVSPETLARTTLGGLGAGDAVNLERAVTLLSRMGGHLVQGHVDGVGEVLDMRAAGDGSEMTIGLPDGLGRYAVEKGSIAVDGVSLTITSLDANSFGVALIPHTLEVTTLGDRAPGDRVNLEVDVMAKYVERLMEGAR
ncbi:MAG TPA: riboflavin synthase [Actinomycetota bacterium]|nr:riboflavin synthase [Actinomycetota bacterium]